MTPQRHGLWPSYSEVGASPAAAPEGAIAVIGIAGRFPQSSSVEQLWERLRDGEDCIVEVPDCRWERARTFRLANGCRWGGFIDHFDKFDASFFETDWKAVCTDPQERVLLELVWHLLERSGYTRRRLLETCRSSVGFYVGATHSDYRSFRTPSSWWLEALVSTVNNGSMANRVSHFYDLRGPSMAVDTFCSSAAVALHLACKDLRAGECSMAIASGVNLILDPDRYEASALTRHLGSHENSRSFADGDGYLPAEAAGAVLLKPLGSAVEQGDNILGVIRASSTNHSGRVAAFGVPNPDAQAEVIEGCLAKAGLGPSDIHYIEASATGAALGDPLELAALRRVFSKGGARGRSWPVGSVKSNIGHAEAASAMTQLAKVLLQLEHGQLAPSIRTDPPNPRLNWRDLPFHLVREIQEWKRPSPDADRPQLQAPRRALLNSFGAGGTNVSIVLEEYVPARAAKPARPVTPAAREEQAIVLSARNTLQLRELTEQMLAFVSGCVDLDVGDLAYTLQVSREAMKSRVALIASDRNGVIAGLTACLRSDLAQDGPIAAEVPVFFGEVAGANLFMRTAADRRLSDADATRDGLARLALEWCQGASIAWASLRRQCGRILVLPTYPFARERCWLESLTYDHPELQSDASVGAFRPSAASVRAPATRLLDPDRITYLAPRNNLEQSLVQIWEDIIGARPVGVTDSFFDVGGDSMLAGLVVNRCQEVFGVRTDVSLLLGREGTIERLAVATVSALANAQIEERSSVEAMIDDVVKETAQ